MLVHSLDASSWRPLPLPQSPFLRLSYHLQLHRNFPSFRLMHTNPLVQPSPLIWRCCSSDQLPSHPILPLLYPFFNAPPPPQQPRRNALAAHCTSHQLQKRAAHRRSIHIVRTRATTQSSNRAPRPRPSYANAIRSHSAAAPATPITSAAPPRFSLPGLSRRRTNRTTSTTAAPSMPSA